MAFSRDIILYLYTFSPYARRVVWYLNLRKIPYTQCLQPPTLPRPDVKALGVSYRRIPLMAIGRDIYCDTRLIIEKLEQFFPASAAHPAISAATGDEKALEKLLEFWMIDGGVFGRAAQLIPTDMPLRKDPKFNNDREDFMGVKYNKEAVEALRPEALTEIKKGLTFLETTLLADGRDWILKTKGPSLAEIEAVWVFHWLQGLKDALPAEQAFGQQFPKCWAWIGRFQQQVSAAARANRKPKTIKGDEAVALISRAEFAEPEGSVDRGEASSLGKGDMVSVNPIDTGVKHKDLGKLVALSVSEIVIESKTELGQAVRVHTPRHGFRVRSAQVAAARL